MDLSGERTELSLAAPLERSASEPRKRLRTRVMAVVRPAFALSGLVVLALLIRKVGAQELKEVLSRAAPWLPVVLALEVGRMLLDAVATRTSYGPKTRHVPLWSIFRAQLITTPVASLAPAGRTAGEAMKAAMLSPYTDGPTATAAAATSQAASLVAGGLISIPCALAAWVLTGPSWLTLALGVHTVVLVIAGAGMRAGMRAHGLGTWLKRRFHRIASHTETFQQSARHQGLLPTRPIAAVFAGRVLQVVQYGTLAVAVGIDTTAVRALVAQGLNMVALAVGTLVPGQFGVSDGAFALSAKIFNTTTAKAMAIAVLAHAMQVLFILAGSLTPVLWRARHRKRS